MGSLVSQRWFCVLMLSYRHWSWWAVPWGSHWSRPHHNRFGWCTRPHLLRTLQWWPKSPCSSTGTHQFYSGGYRVYEWVSFCDANKKTNCGLVWYIPLGDLLRELWVGVTGKQLDRVSSDGHLWYVTVKKVNGMGSPGGSMKASESFQIAPDGLYGT